MILNRDDQAGFRLDSTYTHKVIKLSAWKEFQNSRHILTM